KPSSSTGAVSTSLSAACASGWRSPTPSWRPAGCSCFSTKVVNVGVRDSTYVLDGLLYHESDLRIEEHYTDTAGFTDHVFGLMHLLGFRFAPRIRDLADRRLYVPDKTKLYPSLLPFIGGTINLKQILAQWPEI